MSYFRIAAVAVAVATASAAVVADANDCVDVDGEGFCLESQLNLVEEEVDDLRTELLQTEVKLKRSTAEQQTVAAKASEASPDSLHDLREESFGAESASRDAVRRQIDAMEAQAKAAAAKTKFEDKEPPSKAAPNEQGGPKEQGKVKKHHGKKENKVLEEAMIPVGALLAGVLLFVCQQQTAGLLAIYFGAQAGFSLYMKVVLSSAVVSKELSIDGVPAGFLVTAIQQAVAFVVLVVIVAALYFTPWRYTPRRLNSMKEVACVVLFSFAFALNIGLNNFSLALLAVSLNMIIRSCLPLVTLILQQTLGPCFAGIAGKKAVGAMEVSLMVAGVVFAGLATLAKSEGSHHSSESKNLMLGVMMCGLSDVAAALNLILAGMFGSTLDPPLNPIDTIFYMALPCAVFLLPASFVVLHPVEWPGFGQITDYQVYQKVMELSPTTMGWVVLSGFIAAGYNVLQYTVVQRLSAGHAAFAGNFNKAATIMISICMGLESLPGGTWSWVMLLAILGNIGSFSAFSMLKTDGKAAGKH